MRAQIALHAHCKHIRAYHIMFIPCSHHLTDYKLRHPELPPVSFGLQCLLRAKKTREGPRAGFVSSIAADPGGKGPSCRC